MVNLFQNFFLAFKGPLSFYKNIKIKEGYIILQKVEEIQKEFKLEIDKIVKGKNESEEQKSATNNIKTPYESREKVIKLYDDYSTIVSETKCKSKYGEGLKILTPEQMLQRLPIDIAQVKAGNASEILLNEIRQIIYSLYQAKETNKNVCNKTINSIKV